MATATAKAVLESIEETIDDAQDQLDILEDGAQVVKGTKLVVGGLVFAAACAGAAVTYFIAKKKLSAKYHAIAEQEIAEAKHFYAARNKTGEYSSPSEIAKKYETEPADVETVATITRSYQSEDISEARIKLADQPPHETETSEVVEGTLDETVVNVFKESENAGDFDYEEELRNRTEEAPYIISYEEWTGNESDYEQSTLTYFAGDDTLADSTDQIIAETDETVGDDNLLRFGHGSKDNNVVYIRNDRLELEWEVIRSKGKFAKEVLGFDDEEEDQLQHSYRDRRPRKFRSYDD